MFLKRKQRCSVCRFWENQDNYKNHDPDAPDYGFCKRYPPTGEYLLDKNTDFHVDQIDLICTNDYDWCGEFKRGWMGDYN